jgi:mannose-6-phosphate isomerase-like protein (cupin superfamily)
MNRQVSMLLFVTAAAAAAVGACGKPSQGEPPRAAEPPSSATEPTSAELAESTESLKNAKAFVANIEALTSVNEDFRHVVYTGKHLQVVVMSLPPGEHIGEETHAVDQFFRIEEGSAIVVLDATRTPVVAGSSIVIRAGTRHDIVNNGPTALKLYTVYAPPQHRDGVVHHTRKDAERAKEHFDGKTTR